MKRKRVTSHDLAPTNEEYEKLLDGVKDGTDRLIVVVLGHGGFRAGEFVSIRPDWLRDGRVVIPPADPRTAFRAKTPASARAVPLKKNSRYAWDQLEEWVREHDGVGFLQPTVNYRVTQMGLRILDRRLIPHAFRAYCAMQLAVRTEGNIYGMMNFMGWDTPLMAIYYAKAVGVFAERALDRAIQREAELR